MSQTEQIKKLREKTGAGVMDVKRALEEAGGDSEKATEILRKRGLAKANSKAGRELKAGIVDCYVHQDRVGVLVEVSCETDFVARSDVFRTMVHNVTMQIAAMAPADMDELLAQPHIRNEKQTIDELVKETIAKTGENIKLERFTRYEV